MRALVLAAALVTAACGHPLLKLPSGPGAAVAAPQAASAEAQATSTCASVRTLTAEIAASGSAAGHRLRGRLSAGVAAPASVRLEAIAPFGPPLFILVATAGDATLLLPRDDRVLEHGRPDEVMEAVAGVPLDAADLETTLTGCAPAGATAAAKRYGDLWLVVTRTAGDDLYLRRDMASQPWRLVAAVRNAARAGGAWRAEYGGWEDGVPHAIRLTSIDEKGRAGRAFDIQLALSQVDINMPLAPDVFAVQVPRTARPITIGELRASGPLAPR